MENLTLAFPIPFILFGVSRGSLENSISVASVMTHLSSESRLCDRTIGCYGNACTTPGMSLRKAVAQAYGQGSVGVGLRGS